MKVSVTEVNELKAEKLLIYVCQKMQDLGGFGAILLNKSLYYIDHTHYLSFGKKLSGFKYVKQKLGPTPKPAEFLRIRDRLVSEGKLVERSTNYFGRVQKRLCAVSDKVDVSCFSSEEVNLIDQVIMKLAGYDAKSISDATHEELSWKMADLMEELPEFTYLLTESTLTEDDLEWAHKEISERTTAEIH